MKTRIIELFILFGYRYNGEKPDTRLLFFDCDYEQEVQLWLISPIDNVENLTKAVNLIARRIFERGRDSGKSEIVRGIKTLLELN